MTRFKWVDDYCGLEQEVDEIEFELERSKKELSRWLNVNDLGGYSLTPESRGAKVEEIIEGLEYKLAYKMNEMDDFKKSVSKFKGLDNQILYLRYIEQKSFDDIADQTGYAKGTIYNRHAALMKTIKYFSEIF
ncbi:hypothetical protein MKX47_12345 [Solibacillus sp. FSL R7-0668]|uniref:hypothetical protein n=1 Tax=Solibacillus sp. FSL R7-0668 TaxID=2921688 RepID=UPI0030FA2F2D